MLLHFRGCATLFNDNTFELDFQVESIFVPRDTWYCSGWALELVITKARFSRIHLNGKWSFTVMSLPCHNALLSVRTAMIEEDIDLVAGDCNGAKGRRIWGRTATRQHSGRSQAPLAPDRCGALPNGWLIRKRGAPRSTARSFVLCHTDQTNHYETCIHCEHPRAQSRPGGVKCRDAAHTPKLTRRPK